MNKVIELLLSEKIIKPIIYILVGVLVYHLFVAIIKRVIKVNKKHKNAAKKNTIIVLIKNIVKYILAIVVVLAILNVYGVDTTNLIASIGVVGLVVGLAFQDIIKDFLAGISMIFDNEFTIGDNVQIGTFRGYVQEMTLRSVKIRAYTGEIKIISNHTITEVINYSLADSRLVLDINVSYDTDIDKLEKVLFSMEEEILKITDVKGKLEYLGIENLADSSIVYRLAVDCQPMAYIPVKRTILKMVKEKLDKNNIKIPYPQVEITMNGDKK